MIYLDLWAWFRRYELSAMLQGDTQRRQLVTLARKGWQYREQADAERAIQTFKEAATLAEHLNEPCWRVFHQYWVSEMMFYLQHDYQGTLDYIIRVATECRKAHYDDCPVRSRVFFVLANIYYMIDFYGYEQNIIELLDYIENDVVMDEDTHLRVIHMRSQIDFEHERYDDAETRTHDMLNRSETNHFRQRSGYHMLRAIAYARGNIALANDYAQIAEKYANFIQIQRSIAEGKLWQAVYHKRLGEDKAAHEIYLTALDHYERYNLPREVTYHDAAAEYLELTGELQAALNLRAQLITQVMKTASIYNQMFAHWQYCRLSGRLGEPMDEALTAARAITTTMLKPDVYLEKLADIENGNYWEFAWQRDT